MRIAVLILALVHGLIHFMGFARAFAIGNTAEFTKELSKPIGVVWLLTGLLFIGSAILQFLKKEGWAVPLLIAVVVSQLLIFMVWSDAKYGTIANIILIIAAILGLASTNFENTYKKDVLSGFKLTKPNEELVTGEDLEPLPEIVQKYLRYVGVVGKPKVHNVKIVFEGEMREKGKNWFPFTSEQHNFFGSPARLFFVKAKVKGLSTHGYHAYQKEEASMRIKLLSLISVVDIHGKDLFKTETVTFLNDLCLFAPATLIDNRIQWKVTDELSVKATFTNDSTSISAVLYFNEEGQLINFVSNDRMAVSETQVMPFSTPVGNYKNINGYNLPTYGEAIWDYPDGEFVYGKFNVKSVEYNVSTTK